MENYRKKLKAQNIIFSICALALATVLILGFSGIIKPIEGNEHWKDYWNGMISGMSLAFIAIMIIGIIKNVIALKNPKKIKKQYAKENDERNAQIAEKGKSSGASIFLMIMPVIIIIETLKNFV